MGEPHEFRHIFRFNSELNRGYIVYSSRTSLIWRLGQPGSPEGL
jgi:hypothetical protein